MSPPLGLHGWSSPHAESLSLSTASTEVISELFCYSAVADFSVVFSIRHYKILDLSVTGLPGVDSPTHFDSRALLQEVQISFKELKQLRVRDLLQGVPILLVKYYFLDFWIISSEKLIHYLQVGIVSIHE